MRRAFVLRGFNELQGFGDVGQNAAGAFRRVHRPFKQVGRDAKPAGVFGDLMTVENQPSAPVDRFGNEPDNLVAIERGGLERPGVERAEIGEGGVDAGVVERHELKRVSR